MIGASLDEIVAGSAVGRMQRKALTVAALCVGGAAALAVRASAARRARGVVCSTWRYLWMRWKLRRADRLVIITDFDRTVTTAYAADGSAGASSHGILESCSALSAAYRKKATALLAHYHPIELDPALTIAEKLPIMQEWYHKAHTLLAEQPITMALIADAVAESKVLIRPGLAEMLARAEARGVPFIAYSAGLGNVVAEVLRQQLGDAGARVPVVANLLLFDGPGGRVSGFGDLIHMYNKTGERVRERVDPALLAGRTVALVMGDGLGDATMADGLGMEVVRVGLINQKEAAEQDSRLPSYTSTFDCVLLGDTSFDFVNELLG